MGNHHNANGECRAIVLAFLITLQTFVRTSFFHGLAICTHAGFGWGFSQLLVRMNNTVDTFEQLTIQLGLKKYLLRFLIKVGKLVLEFGR